jgi:hypothetical protein
MRSLPVTQDVLLRIAEEDVERIRIQILKIKRLEDTRGLLKEKHVLEEEMRVTEEEIRVTEEEICVAEGEIRLLLEDADHQFQLRWNLAAKLLKKPEEIEAFVGMMADLYESDVNEHGRFWARILYRQRVLTSIWPILSWLLHTIEALRRMVG